MLLFLILLFATTSAAEPNPNATKPCDPSDLKGLNGFKSAILRDSSGILAKWVGDNCCQWQGILCDNTTGRVTEINLPGSDDTGDSISEYEREGTLSPSLHLLTSLQVLIFNDQGPFTGSIPPEIGSLPNLRKLHLYGNKLSGPIPPSIGNLSSLEELIVYRNQLSGSLPPALGDLKNLTNLILYDNQLTGPIPDTFGNMKSLVRLELARNNLTGPIPVSLGDLQALAYVDLSDNRLTGEIPVGLSKLTKLEQFYVPGNLLQGPIPDGEAFGRLEPRSFEGNKGLCGKPLRPCKR